MFRSGSTGVHAALTSVGEETAVLGSQGSPSDVSHPLSVNPSLVKAG